VSIFFDATFVNELGIAAQRCDEVGDAMLCCNQPKSGTLQINAIAKMLK
jgi:hypothetical protein